MNRPRATGKTWEFKDDAEEAAKAICGMRTNGILSLREVNGAGQIEKNWLHIGAFVRDLRFSGGPRRLRTTMRFRCTSTTKWSPVTRWLNCTAISRLTAARGCRTACCLPITRSTKRLRSRMGSWTGSRWDFTFSPLSATDLACSGLGIIIRPRVRIQRRNGSGRWV